MSTVEELIQLAQSGDSGAGQRLLEENSGLIWSIARRYVGRGTELEDLYQLGCVGFVKAVQGFDTSFGTKFSTYAVPKIAGEIRRFLRDDGTIKVSRGIKEQAAQIKSTRTALINEMGREPTLQQISERLGISVEDIAAAEAATAATDSINRPMGEDGFSLENLLTDTESEEKIVERIALLQAIEKLNEREAMVIKLRYFHALTQDRVSKVLNVSQVQVSRIEKKALARLKDILE